MYIVRFNTKTYRFQSKDDALGFAKTWSLQVEEKTDEIINRSLFAQSSHALDTVANLPSKSAIIDLIKTYDLEWYSPFYSN
ncbi:MAG: hypothetical protein HYZ51_03000 [Candidatus Doudnabacteria bacterium]|nr:hypothetical protein [Candidatus Doudnabacteria bacterium]